MLIKSRMGVSVDGFVANADGVPAIALAAGFEPGQSHGFRAARPGVAGRPAARCGQAGRAHRPRRALPPE